MNHTYPSFIRPIIVFFLVTLLCLAFLAGAALLPQESIAANISASLPGLVAEGTYPSRNGVEATMLDNFTDSLILMETLATNSSDLNTIISNPLYLYLEDPLESLVNLCDNPELEPDGYYVRYWMGFRVTLRPLFLLFTYAQIRKLMVAVLCLLAFAAALSLCKNINLPAGLGLLAVFLLVRPLIIGRSFQFSTCFLLAFLSLLLLPPLYRRRRDIPLFFLVLGMLTQFFDFYTVPVITFCFPVLYFIALRARSGQPVSVRTVLALFCFWAAGYLAFWLMKLLLSSLFSPIDGFRNGLSELVYWMERGVDSETNKFLYAYERVWSVFCPDSRWLLYLSAFFLLPPVFRAVRFRKAGIPFVSCSQLSYLVVGCLPLIWFGAAATPTANHAFFQYRSVAAVLWAWCLLFTADVCPSVHSLPRVFSPVTKGTDL